MIKRKNILLLFIFMFVMSYCFIVFNSFEAVVYATANTFTVEDYTNSDNLLKSDGTPADKDIKQFANEVKSAESNTSFSELAQVVPKQYLESTTTNATYQYNGKEYGFYMVKDFDYMS